MGLLCEGQAALFPSLTFRIAQSMAAMHSGLVSRWMYPFSSCKEQKIRDGKQ